VVSAVALLFLIAVLLAGVLPSVLGYESFVVLSGSMEPNIHVGDLAVVAPRKPSEFMVGDVITYRTTAQPDVVVTHRIVGIGQDEDGRLSFETKGDANVVVDSVAVEQGAVLGRVAYALPYVGYLVDFSRRPEGKLLLIGLPGVLLVLDYFLGMRRRRQSPVTAVHGEAGELIARGRVAQQNGGTQAAVALFDRAIAADPHADEAWLLKAECLPEGPERVACLRAGLTVNPGSASLRHAVEQASAAETATG